MILTINRQIACKTCEKEPDFNVIRIFARSIYFQDQRYGLLTLPRKMNYCPAIYGKDVNSHHFTFYEMFLMYNYLMQS